MSSPVVSLSVGVDFECHSFVPSVSLVATQASGISARSSSSPHTPPVPVVTSPPKTADQPETIYDDLKRLSFFKLAVEGWTIANVKEWLVRIIGAEQAQQVPSMSGRGLLTVTQETLSDVGIQQIAKNTILVELNYLKKIKNIDDASSSAAATAVASIGVYFIRFLLSPFASYIHSLLLSYSI